MNDPDEAITGNIWTHDDAFQNYRKLCLEFQGRFAGSSQARAAADFIAERLDGYRLDTVARHRFDLVTWERGDFSLRMTSPRNRDLPGIALPYSPGCDAEWDVIDLGMGHPRDFARAAGKIAGKAVLIDDSNPPDGPRLHRLQKYVAALEAGAGAFIFIQGFPGMLPQTGSLAFRQDDGPDQGIPAVGIAGETAAEIRAWLGETGGATVHLRMDNRLDRGEDMNIVADLEPEGAGRDTVVVCGHYDGHDIAQGAVDNASGTAVVMEIARVLAPLKDRLKRRIRFILFSGEELGLLGSTAYAAQVDPAAIRFVLNLDCVGHPGPLHLMTQDIPGLEPVLESMVRKIPADIHVENHLVPFSDHFPFYLKGAPCAFCVTPGDGGGRGWGHTAADTFEKVRRDTLMRVASHIARLVMRIANSEEWPSVRVAPDRIRESLTAAGMKNLLQFEDLWPF